MYTDYIFINKKKHCIMKKVLLVSFIFALVSGVNLFAGNSDVFSFDKNKVEAELAELTELESFVEANQSVTLTDLMASGHALVAGLNLNMADPSGLLFGLGEPPLGIPSFLWGCVFGVVGLAIVYFVTDDKEETKKALWGCITASAVSLVVSIIWMVVAAAAVTTASTTVY
ncbi:MAG: hypothetical protein ACOCWG_06455 [bacterium]